MRLLDGGARPADELACAAGVTGPTASSHRCANGWLRRTPSSRVVQVTPQGRTALRYPLGLDTESLAAQG